MMGHTPLDRPIEIVEIEDERGTEALARWLAHFVQPGDVIVLGGELGAGKTAFARAFLREATGEAELETPSPTFTIVQSYEGKAFPLVHADFYRLRGAEDLAQIGWSETIDGAVA